MSETLFESISPWGNLQAVVEVEGAACFLYLVGAEESGFGMRSVWIRNLGRAPDTLDVAALEAGTPPPNPRPYVVQVEASPPLNADDLRVVWLPEGDGVALYDKSSLLAIIPPWSADMGSSGYSRDSAKEGPLAWPLRPDNELIERFAAAEAYWRQWERGNPWPKARDALLARLERELGPHDNYYAIDGNQWPPRALARFEGRDRRYLVTVGVSLLPQPQVEMHVEDPAPLRRVELGVVAPAEWSDDEVMGFAQYLSAQARLPWSRFTWLGPGHTIGCDSWPGARFSAAALVHEHPAHGHLRLPDQFGDPVSVLWFLPLTGEERDRAEAAGTQVVLDGLPATRWRAR